MKNHTNRLRFGPEELFAVLEREMRGQYEAPASGTAAVARPMGPGEAQVPCHPRERVLVRKGAIDAACPDCGVSFPLLASRGG